MLIYHDDGLIRELQFDEKLTKVGSDPQLWQLKPFYDAATLGVEFIWPYPNWCTQSSPKGFQVEWFDDFYMISFPSHISVKENYNLYIMPHHSSYVGTKWNVNRPVAVPQIIEADWWPGELKIVFVRNDGEFVRGEPFAQAMAIPRKDCELKTMPAGEQQRREAARAFLRENADQFITRQHQGRDNLYETLSHLKKSDELPEEIQLKKHPKPRLFWQ
ncbi:hypothetical protein DRQ00_09090 [candidate division KSB1 bacterium]|nr:MAG: hypothetical protein DRQ00_09090 [candidate division KSB1 bacterium]